MAKAHSRMPVMFFGHGSPMNTLERNKYTETWQKLGESIPRPKAILCVSAHWYTEGTAVTAMEKPKTIHDFYGFPQALFDVQYPAPGDPRLAARVRELLEPVEVRLDDSWGLDHGTWSVVKRSAPAITGRSSLSRNSARTHASRCRPRSTTFRSSTSLRCRGRTSRCPS